MRRTTTKQIADAISNNQLQIQKVESFNKKSRKTETIEADTFREHFDFLCKSGILANAIGWTYERDFREDNYFIAETGRMEGNANVIITVYLSVGLDVNAEEVERKLMFVEEE